MATIKSFRALRPTVEKAKQVSCVPYDVVYEREVREFIGKNPLSFLRVTRSEAEFPEGETPAPEIVFARAKENLDKFINDEVLFVEDEPSIYIYRLANETHSQTGIVACCSIDEYERDIIKKHEKTRPDKVEDRTGHMIELKAQTGLIFLAFRNTETIKNLIAETVETKPLYNFHCSDGVRQTIWKVGSSESFINAFEEVPALYIADGHHRMESARLAMEKMREQNENHSETEDYNYVVAGMFPSEDLRILAYNRVVKDLNGLTEEEFFQKISENFIVSETKEKEPSQHAEISMYLGGKWYNLHFAVNYFQEPNPIERLDVSILQDYILGPILGIDDPRTSRKIGFIGGARGTDELEKYVDDGTAKVAFSLYPTMMDDLFAVSDMGEIMPPKSTWFEPKLKDGLLIHLI